MNSASATDPQREHPRVIDSTSLRKKQQEFFQRLWETVAEQKGTLAPQAILTEIVDLDGRVVDLMDDAAASGVSLREYLDFYAHLDVIPELADKQLAELTLREALWSIDQASTFDENPPACPAGLSRVVSQSGLNSFCRLPAARMTAIRDSDVASHSEADNISGILAQPNIKGLLGAGKAGSEIDAILLQISAKEPLHKFKRMCLHMRAGCGSIPAHAAI